MGSVVLGVGVIGSADRKARQRGRSIWVAVRLVKVGDGFVREIVNGT
jgi:hypothetical protein